MEDTRNIALSSLLDRHQTSLEHLMELLEMNMCTKLNVCIKYDTNLSQGLLVSCFVAQRDPQ